MIRYFKSFVGLLLFLSISNVVFSQNQKNKTTNSLYEVTEAIRKTIVPRRQAGMPHISNPVIVPMLFDGAVVINRTHLMGVSLEEIESVSVDYNYFSKKDTLGRTADLGPIAIYGVIVIMSKGVSKERLAYNTHHILP